jgi:pimeloyl-ACP methyl ester carboxylesterase
MSRQLMIPAGDTRLYAVDAPGGTPALLFLSGGFGTVQNWSRVIRSLDGKYRTVRFDARARGKSGRSADYSVQAAVDDIGRIIEATGIERPILVGWSHGATIAVRYAAQHPATLDTTDERTPANRSPLTDRAPQRPASPDLGQAA